MLKLKDVSKFYYSKGIIATGFTKVSATFNLGEFVVITGESGSGKSTLLNVISGMDSYEEGEMYIGGEETSHYMESEFESYRRKYISNIFQNFNLVNSYTVYQNVELVLLINGNKKSKIKKKVLDILKEVQLYEFRNTKVSKLSGGQKQRVAIARALAKESKIIIADEPTGNLDKASAASVLSLLNKISKDKLVIMVTHNYDQVEKYATRKIKMHDGKIVEDKKIKDVNIDVNLSTVEYKDITVSNKLRLGIRNTFNIFTKFSLLFLVFLFLVAGFLLEYASFKRAEYEESISGYNNFFTNTDDRRIIIKKDDKTYFTDDDYLKIEKLTNVDYIIKDDLLLDNSISIHSGDTYLYGNVKSLDTLEGKVDVGVMPKEENEIIIAGYKDDYYLSNQKETILNNNFLISDFGDDTLFKVVGIKYIDENLIVRVYGQYEIYGSDLLLNKTREYTEKRISVMKVNLEGKVYETKFWGSFMNVTPSNLVNVGEAYISRDYNGYCKNYNCLNKEIGISNESLYYINDINLKITKTYTKNNFSSLTGDTNYEENQGRIYISNEDYNNLFQTNYYQSSVFVKDVEKINEVNNSLKDLNLDTLLIKDALITYDEGAAQIINIIKLITTIIFVVVMFFISYFIIKIILKSRNIYFTIIRILGVSKKVCKKLLDIELFAVANLAYFTFVLFVSLIRNNIIEVEFLYNTVKFLKIKDFIMIYLIIILITQLISNKFAKSLFKKSAMKTFSEVV